MNETVERAAFVDLEPTIPREHLVDGVLDFGRLVEALVFYDRVYVSAPREAPFLSLCRRLKSDDDFSDFVALLQNREVIIVDRDFYTSIQITDAVSLAAKAMNLVDPLSAAGKSFEQRSLGAPALQSIVADSERVELARAALEHLFLIKLGKNGALLTKDADRDYATPATASFLLAELAGAVGVPLSDRVLVRDVVTDGAGFTRVTWTVDFERLNEEARRVTGLDGPVIRPTDPLGAAIGRDRLLWSARVTESDLHLSRPMDVFVTNKLREAGHLAKGVHDIITPVSQEAEFPDLRGDSNNGLIGLGDALRFRSKAKRFRRWLHDERTHDRDAVSAYLGEFTRDSGLTSAAQKVLSISGAAIGGIVGAAVTGPDGALAGAAAGAVTQTLISELAGALTSTWRPIIFGSWLNRAIERRQLR